MAFFDLVLEYDAAASGIYYVIPFVDACAFKGHCDAKVFGLLCCHIQFCGVSPVVLKTLSPRKGL